MNAHTGSMQGGPMTPAFAHALAEGFGGTFVAGERLAKWLPADLVGADPDAAMVAPAVMQRLGSAAGRSPGMRDAIDRDHPIAIALRARLARTPDAVPAPDDAIVAMLAGFREFAKNGNVITIRGVPIPAGAEQVAYYVALRWRPLFSPLADPACVYRGHLAYDAAHCTDEMQESILLVSTRVHRDYLIHLQRTAPAVFVAIWLRHATATERLIARTPVSALPHPYPRSRIGDRRRQVAELVRDAELSEAWARREVFIRAIAPLLPALSPITDDPYLHERLRIDPKSPDVRIATEGAWNC